MKLRNLAIIIAGLLTFSIACTVNTPTTTSSLPTTSPTSTPPTTPPPITGTTGIPGVEVVTVALDNTITQNPGGPTIVIELKNIEAEAIISLDVKLYEPSYAKLWTFDFGVDKDHLFVPGTTIGRKQTIIGPSGWGTGIPYFVTISSTYSNEATFAFRWNPPGDGDYGTVTPPP
ncbi:MAG: hypothetical protein TUN42_08345 [Dehalogenimonas sp.]